LLRPVGLGVKGGKPELRRREGEKKRRRSKGNLSEGLSPFSKKRKYHTNFHIWKYREEEEKNWKIFWGGKERKKAEGPIPRRKKEARKRLTFSGIIFASGGWGRFRDIEGGEGGINIALQLSKMRKEKIS